MSPANENKQIVGQKTPIAKDSLARWVGSAGLAFSFFNLILAINSARETEKNNRLNHEALVRATVSFPSDLRERSQGMARETLFTVPLTAHLLNHGKSAAHDIIFEYRITLGAEVLRDFTITMSRTQKGTRNTELSKIDPDESQDFDVPPLLIQTGKLTDALEGKSARLMLCTQVSFRDEYHQEPGKQNCSSFASKIQFGF